MDHDWTVFQEVFSVCGGGAAPLFDTRVPSAVFTKAKVFKPVCPLYGKVHLKFVTASPEEVFHALKNYARRCGSFVLPAKIVVDLKVRQKQEGDPTLYQFGGGDKIEMIIHAEGDDRLKPYAKKYLSLPWMTQGQFILATDEFSGLGLGWIDVKHTAPDWVRRQQEGVRAKEDCAVYLTSPVSFVTISKTPSRAKGV